MLTLVLTRHGSTPRSDPEQHLGQRLDLPLSEAGRRAAQALGERLAGVSFDRVIASPLRRAVETAHLAVPERGIATDARLAEMDYGRWEGLTYGEIDAVDADVRRRWEADPAGLACPGGESGADVAARVGSFLDELVAWAAGDAGERRVLAVAHSTTNRVLLAVALGVPLREYRRRFVQSPANLTVLRFDASAGSGARLLVCNDVAHVRGLHGTTWG
jgi:broad specificity phosphatase PhoE